MAHHPLSPGGCVWQTVDSCHFSSRGFDCRVVSNAHGKAGLPVTILTSDPGALGVPQAGKNPSTPLNQERWQLGAASVCRGADSWQASSYRTGGPQGLGRGLSSLPQSASSTHSRPRGITHAPSGPSSHRKEASLGIASTSVQEGRGKDGTSCWPLGRPTQRGGGSRPAEDSDRQPLWDASAGDTQARVSWVQGRP